MECRHDRGVSGVIELKVHLARDEETGIWYVSGSDVPGLRLEARNAPDLMREIENVAADLIELNKAEIVNAHAARIAERDQRNLAFAVRPIIETALTVA